MSIFDAVMFYIVFMKKKYLIKIIFIFLVICFTQITSFSLTIEGGISYTVDDVRKMAFENVQKQIQPVSIYDERYKFNLYGNTKNVLNITDYKISCLKILSVTALSAIYKDNPNKEYVYIRLFGEYSLDSINIQEPLGNGNARTVKYDYNTGKLRTIFVLISDVYPLENQECYVFNAKGKLIGHWKGYYGTMYKNKVKLSRNIRYWEQK